MTEVSNVIQNFLVVDDDPILRNIVKLFLTDLKVPHIYTASDGQHALEILNQKSQVIDFVLCDLNMPNLDGIQFLSHLAQLKFSGAIAIASGEDQSVISLSERLAETHGLNIVGAMRKPLDIEVLKSLMLQVTVRDKQPVLTNLVHFSECDLRDALKQGHITSYYQPKFNVQSGKLTGTESLVRWLHPELGLISPDLFIPLAEETQLIDDLTKLVFEKTIIDAKRWKRLRYDIKHAVNISVSSLYDASLPNILSEIVKGQGLNCEQFVLEITENKLLQQDAIVMEVLARLRMKGFELSIDDFGTGFSNMERIKDYPFDELKIDQSFVSKATGDDAARSIVESCASLGKDLGLKLVAEGVETEEDRKFVASLGVDEIQGFLYAKPMSIDDLLPWFLDYNPVQIRSRLP